MITKVLVFVGFVIVLVGLALYLTPYVTSLGGEYLNVPALQTLTLTMHFEKGEEMEGYLNCKQANIENPYEVGSGDIRFYIENPYGAVILDAGTVTGRHDFAFTAEHSGVFTLYFDNTFSLLTYKTIILRYEVTVKSAYPELSLPTALIGIAILVVGLIGIYEQKKK